MLLPVFALVLQAAAPGPYVDLSTPELGMHVDRSTIIRTGDRARFVLTVTSADGTRSEHDYGFDCTARTVSAATWRTLDAQGQVATRHHAQMRPSHHAARAEDLPLMALACENGDGGRPQVEALPAR